MRRLNLVVFLVGISFLLSGCDWVRGELGMPQSSDLKVAREKKIAAAAEQAKKDQARIKMMDSLAAVADTLSAKQDSLKNTIAVTASDTQGRYHVIMGSFKDSLNCSKLSSILIKHGYKPSLVKLKNGYTLVSAASFNNQGDANREMQKILDTDYAPDDIWVYDMKKNNK